MSSKSHFDGLLEEYEDELVDIRAKRNAISFAVDYHQLFRRQELTDFEFRFAGLGGHPLGAHRAHLMAKRCAKVDTNADHMMIADTIDRLLFEKVVEALYCEAFDLEVSDTNVAAFEAICDTLGNDALKDQIRLTRDELVVKEDVKTVTEMKTRLLKRKASDAEAVPSKRARVSDGDQPVIHQTSVPSEVEVGVNGEPSDPKTHSQALSVGTDVCNQSPPSAVPMNGNKWLPIPSLLASPQPCDDYNQKGEDLDTTVASTPKPSSTRTSANGCQQSLTPEATPHPMDDQFAAHSSCRSRSNSLSSSESYRPRANSGNQLTRTDPRQLRPRATADAKTLYTIDKLVAHSSSTASENLWDSCIVPTKHERNIVVVVGDQQLVWYDLDANYKPLATFEAPVGLTFRCVGYTSTEVSGVATNVCAAGSQSCVLFCREPDNGRVEAYERVHVVGAEVTAIAFNPLKPNYMYCGTDDRKVYVWELFFEADGALNANKSSYRYLYATNFCIVSIVYLLDTDSLAAVGESSDVLLFNDISAPKPYVGRFTLSRKLRSISSVTYVPSHNVLAFRAVGCDTLYTADLDKMVPALAGRKSAKPHPKHPDFVTLTHFKWGQLKYGAPKGADIQFVNLAYNCGLIACGNDSGQVLVYGAAQLFKTANLDPLETLDATDKWPSTMSAPIIMRSVSISNDKKYVIGTTNKNIICFWKSTAI